MEPRTPGTNAFLGTTFSTARAKETALSRLRALIEVGDVQTAGRLPPERVLAEQIGVSRRVVRHALDMLEAEGRITRQQGRGTLICDARAGTLDLSNQLVKLTNPVDTLEARMAIEPALARLAALRGTQADFDKLFEAADASRDARDPISYEKADAAFHRRIAVAARNPLLVTIFEAVLHVASDRSWRHGRETAHCINNQARYAAAHRKIAVAVCERNPTSAEEAMRAHLAMVQQRLIEHAFPRPEMT
jgi:DNA-binding FadR family transcriptional regulator